MWNVATGRGRRELGLGSSSAMPASIATVDILSTAIASAVPFPGEGPTTCGASQAGWAGPLRSGKLHSPSGGEGEPEQLLSVDGAAELPRATRGFLEVVDQDSRSLFPRRMTDPSADENRPPGERAATAGAPEERGQGPAEGPIAGPAGLRALPLV